MRRAADTRGEAQPEWCRYELAAVAESSSEALLGSTAEGTVRSWSVAAEKLFGYSAEEAVGVPIEILVPDCLKQRERDLFRTVLGGARIENHVTRRRRKDGTEIDVIMTLVPIRDDRFESVGVLTSARGMAESRAVDEKTRRLLDSVPDAMVVAASNGIITFVNRATESMFGFGRTDLLGEPVEKLVPERSRAGHKEHVGRFFADPKVRRMGAGLELHGLRRDGTEFPAEISLSPVCTQEGMLVSAIIRDVTERRRAQGNTGPARRPDPEAAGRLHDLDQLKDEFLSIVSHELRTPLTSIVGFTEILQRSRVLEAGMHNQLLERISRNASEMSMMIEQLLDYSRLRSGRVSIGLETIHVRAQVIRCTESYENVLSARKVAFDVAEDLRARADVQAFRRILGNLLTNAAKFSSDGSIITITAKRRDAEVVISVRDEGVGIPPEEQDRVFTGFNKGSLTASRRGTGIGLGIVRRYVELCGGRVWVHSIPGKGSTFYFSLASAEGAA